MRKIICLSFFAYLLLPNLLSANCKVKNSQEDGAIATFSGQRIYVGQVFVACQTGPINDISFKLYSHGYAALGAEVRIAPGSEVIENNGILLGTKDIQTTQHGFPETLNFSPSTIYEVIKGQTYVWWLEMDIYPINNPQGENQGNKSGGLEFVTYSNSTDPNLGPLRHGTFSRSIQESTATGRMNQVLVFHLSISHLGASIPTMNEWGLFIFGLVLLNLGVYFIYQKQRILKE